MIKVSEERLCGNPIKINCKISFSDLSDAIKQLANQCGLDLCIEEDAIKVGTGLFKSAEDCLVVYNEHHMRDYYNYAIVQRMQGDISFVSVYCGGNSKNYTRQIGASNVGGIVGFLAKPNYKKQQDEQAYYQMVKKIIGTAIQSV